MKISGKSISRFGCVSMALAAILSISGCGGTNTSSDEPAKGDEIVFWTPHVTPARVKVQERVAQDFEDKTGIKVKVVPMSAADMNQAIVSNAAAGELPDVALLGPDQVASWNAQGLVDTDAARKVIDELGRDTFSDTAMQLVEIDGEPAAVPSDGWGELLYYRTDIFEQLGLEAPQSVDDVVAAAETIESADIGIAGIVLGTQPANAMAEENFEHIGLASGCKMFNDAGEVDLESDACVQATAAFQELANASVSGDQDVDSTRAAYLAGQAAMVLWSPHLLDEIANLEPNFPVSAPGVEDDPLFLAKNTGVVGGLTGVHNTNPTGMGLTMNISVMHGADADAAVAYAQYLLTDGYIDSLSMTPEGRIPVRAGNTPGSSEYIDAWADLKTGVDDSHKLALSEAFSSDVVQEVSQAANSFTRWGFGTEHWATAGAVTTQTALVNDLGKLLNGQDPAEYAASIAENVRSLQEENE